MPAALPSTLRTIAAFALAPLAAVSLYAAILGGDLVAGNTGLFTPAQILVGIFLTAAIVEVVVFLPLFLLSARVRAAGLAAYVAGGAAIGLLLAVLLNIGGGPASWTYYTMAGGAATLALAVFWIVRNGLRRQPA